eukprot:2943232-Amphidinium_carterae.1
MSLMPTCPELKGDWDVFGVPPESHDHHFATSLLRCSCVCSLVSLARLLGPLSCVSQFNIGFEPAARRFSPT